jgi:hypothetical protein
MNRERHTTCSRQCHRRLGALMARRWGSTAHLLGRVQPFRVVGTCRCRMRLLSLVTVPLLLGACDAESRREHAPAVRQPSAQERLEIVAVTTWDYAYESDSRPYRRHRIGVRLRLSRLQPQVVSIRISRSDPRFAVSAVELRDALGRRRPGTEVRLLKRIRGQKPLKSLARSDPPWELVAESGIGFPLACTRATPKAVRELVCPDPWSVLRYPRPRIRLNTTAQMRIPSPQVRAVDWRRVAVPGAACGARNAIHTRPNTWGDAFVRSAVFPWWPAVAVATGSNGVRYGDLDGDRRQEAALTVVCSNAGGTAAGQLAFSSVIFGARGRLLKSIGIITPRQPLDPAASHVPLLWAEIRRGRVIAHEAWYGPHDGSCCASGRVRTIWAYSNGALRPTRTIIEREPRR